MSKKYIAALTLGLGVPAFFLSRIIWPDPLGATAPPAGLIPFLIVPSVAECLAFGAGVAFMVAAGRTLVAAPGSGRLAFAAYVSAGWALVSWWPHSNLHRVNTSLQGLVLIDWTFHLTLIAGAVVLGIFVHRTLRRLDAIRGTNEVHVDRPQQALSAP
jgi:hypothetical protein